MTEDEYDYGYPDDTAHEWTDEVGDDLPTPEEVAEWAREDMAVLETTMGRKLLQHEINAIADDAAKQYGRGYEPDVEAAYNGYYRQKGREPLNMDNAQDRCEWMNRRLKGE